MQIHGAPHRRKAGIGTILTVAVLSLISFAPTVRATANYHTGTVDKIIAWPGGGTQIYLSFTSTTDPCVGGSDARFRVPAGDGHDRIVRLALAAQLSGREVYVQIEDTPTSNDCDVLQFTIQ